MTLYRIDPAGADGATPVLADGYDQVVQSGAATVKFSAAAGMSRGSEIGLEFLGGTVAADTAYVGVAASATTDAAAMFQIYGSWTEFPLGNALIEFMRIRSGTVSSGTLLARFMIASSDHSTMTPGTIVCQNAAGTAITAGAGATWPFVATLGEVNKYELGVKPGASTSNGLVAAKVYDDTGTIVADMGHTAADVNAGLLAPTRGMVGKLAATGTNFKFRATQFGIDSGASIPTIPGVAKNAVVVPSVGYAYRVWDGSTWRR
jgi:hypothetical protein